MWLRHQGALAAALAEAGGLPADDPRCRLVAAFALQTPTLALGSPHPAATVDACFELIASGWQPG